MPEPRQPSKPFAPFVTTPSGPLITLFSFSHAPTRQRYSSRAFRQMFFRLTLGTQKSFPMFEKKSKQFDALGREIITGTQILDYIPGPVLFHLKNSCEGYGLDWERIQSDCTLFLDQKQHCSIMYQVGQWPFSGKLLLTFALNPKYDYRISYPDKGRFLAYTLSHYGHLD